MDGRGTQTIDWYPSEYMYRSKSSEYCLAIEKFNRANEILMGGTFMRQNNIIFDNEHDLLGFARASCNQDPAQIADSSEMELKEINIGQAGSVPLKTKITGQRYVKDLDTAFQPT
jgi:Xylanase inhibitor C-terminal